MTAKRYLFDWISVNDQLPVTYSSYDALGTDMEISDIVITNEGVGAFYTRHDNYTGTGWVSVDWDCKYAGRLMEAPTHWMTLPKLGVGL